MRFKLASCYPIKNLHEFIIIQMTRSMVFLAQTFSAINFWIFLQTITKHISKNIYFSFFFSDLISKKKKKLNCEMKILTRLQLIFQLVYYVQFIWRWYPTRERLTLQISTYMRMSVLSNRSIFASLSQYEKKFSCVWRWLIFSFFFYYRLRYRFLN